MGANCIVVFIPFLIIAQASAGAMRDDTIGPAKLALFSKALHTIAKSHCGSSLSQSDLSDFQAFLNRRISTSEVATLASPQHFTDLYNNLTGCADFVSKKFTEDQDYSTPEMSSTVIPPRSTEPETTDVSNKVKPSLIDSILHDPIQQFLKAIGYILKQFGMILQDKPRTKRDAYMQTDTTKILKGMIEIAINQCPNSYFPISREYLTMIVKLMALQVELGENKDKEFSKLSSKISECALKQ